MDTVPRPKYEGSPHICADCGERIGFQTYNNRPGPQGTEYYHYDRRLCAANRRRKRKAHIDISPPIG